MHPLHTLLHFDPAIILLFNGSAHANASPFCANARPAPYVNTPRPCDHPLQPGQTHLHLHGVGVDLAHVLAGVVAPHVPDLELPGVVVGVDDVHAVVVGDDAVVDSEDGLSVCLNPRYLHGRHTGLAGSRGGSALGSW